MTNDTKTTATVVVFFLSLSHFVTAPLHKGAKKFEVFQNND